MLIVPYSGEGFVYLKNNKFIKYSFNDQLKKLTEGRWISNYLFSNDQLIFGTKNNFKTYFTLDFENGEIKTDTITKLENFHSKNTSGEFYVSTFKDLSFYYFKGFSNQSFEQGRAKLDEKQALVCFQKQCFVLKNNNFSSGFFSIDLRVNFLSQDDDNNLSLIHI